CVAAADIDKDGDIDLFVGALSVPKTYGLTPRSHLYINDGTGHFSDMDIAKMAGIDKAGMITAAAWTDITGDKQKELVIAGMWMAPGIFTYKHDHFEAIKTNLTDLPGLWRALAAADINGDEKTDLVLGNIGENFYLHPAKEKPAKIWINDFDNNGSVDKIITYTVNGKDVPVFLKQDLQDQVPLIKKQNLRHEDYAGKSIQELFSADILASCQVKEFNYPSSCIAINNGSGNFTIQKMPPAIQWSCINSIYCTDVNNDGFTDIVTDGNDADFVPQLQTLDAGFGNILLNNGKGTFTPSTAFQSGLQLNGVVRDIKEVKAANKKYLLFLRNNDYPAMYKINK
ncbi:MAG TPA: VCBS repeat-containing protein, partial [Panacibacter sp.]|nr:VCBS repeat-containing protein [Panacibacter sp.]